MQCPYCGQDKDKVIDSRSSEGGKVIRRRRECLKCSKRFTTYERVEDSIRLTVIKKDGTRVPFDRAKILAGLQAACYKRPVSERDLRNIADQAEEEIFKSYSKEAPSSFIGEIVSHKLREVDQVAYVRFASIYRSFQDVGEFIDEATEVMKSPADTPGQGRLFGDGEDGSKSS